MHPQQSDFRFIATYILFIRVDEQTENWVGQRCKEEKNHFVQQY